MSETNKNNWRTIINIICTILTAIGTALTTTSCIPQII